MTQIHTFLPIIIILGDKTILHLVHLGRYITPKKCMLPVSLNMKYLMEGTMTTGQFVSDITVDQTAAFKLNKIGKIFKKCK